MGSHESLNLISKKNLVHYIIFLGYPNAVILGETKAITEKTSFTFMKIHEY